MSNKALNILLVIFGLLIIVVCKAQVYNGSFEVSACPNFLGTTADGWQNMHHDTDLISACDSSSQADYSCVGVPCNWFGCQYPKDGSNYISICLGAEANEVREWIRGEMEPMVKDSVYLVTFYYSKADRYTLSCNNIGVYFGDIPYQNPYLTDYSFIDYSKVLSERNVLIDTTQWVQFNQYYIAKGGENTISLGNFYPDYLTKYVGGGTEFKYAYYYIDMVSVTRVQATSIPEYPVKVNKKEFNYTLLGQIK